MKNLLRFIALILLASVFLTGCEKKCTVPPGTYEMTMSPIEGDCLENIWKPFDGHTDTLEVEEGRACRSFLTTEENRLSANCTMDMQVSAIQNQSGITDGQAVLRVKCDDDYQCRHLFQVEYRHLEGP